MIYLILIIVVREVNQYHRKSVYSLSNQSLVSNCDPNITEIVTSVDDYISSSQLIIDDLLTELVVSLIPTIIFESNYHQSLQQLLIVT